MKRNSLIAAAAGVLGGVMLVAAWHGSLLGIMLGMMFSPLPLAMTVFGLGLPSLPVAIVGGTIAVTVLTGSVALAAVYLVFDAAPLAILARIGLTAEKLKAEARETAPLVNGQAIAIPVIALALAGVALVAVGLAMAPAEEGGLEAGLITRLDQLVTESGVLGDMPEATRNQLVESMARALPGAAAWNWILRALASAVLGQALLARDGLARWPTPAYRTVAVPGWYVGVFWAGAVAAWLMPGDAGFVAANMAFVMSLPMVLQGLAVVHCTVAHFGYGRMALVAFYGLTLVMAGPALVMIIALGVIEHFSQMRRRMAAARNGG